MILKARAPHGGTAGEPMRIEKYGNSIGNIQDSEGWARSDGPDHDVDTLKRIEIKLEKQRVLQAHVTTGRVRGHAPGPDFEMDTLNSIDILLEKQ